MKIKPVRNFLWTVKLPLFEKDKIYEVKDSIGHEMIKHNYALSAEELEKESKNDKFFDNSAENKMIDIGSKPKKIKTLSLNKKIKKSK